MASELIKRGLPDSTAWRNGLNFPIYVPENLLGIRPLLSAGLVMEACDELWRMAKLGSDPAAALLGYLSFRGIPWDGADEKQIHDRCRDAAVAGNSYAQYVIALTEGRSGALASALKWRTLEFAQHTIWLGR